MKLGIKVAPGNAWQQDIEATRPAMVEIWYNAGHPELYTELFAYLADKPIAVGLHFWGATPDGYLAGSGSELLKAAIDTASRRHCVYVNIHPDLKSALQVNLTTMDIRVASETADETLVRNTFIEHIKVLNDYAAKKQVLLTVETVPQRDTSSWLPDRDRTRVIDIHQLPLDVCIELSRQGVAVANDFCHTACNMISEDRDIIWNFLEQTTRMLAPATRLIHLGFLVPPYNGVDFHDQLDNPVFETPAAIPSKNEMVKLLNLFTKRDDVFILVEPKNDHVKNYFLARNLLEEASKI